MPPTYDTIIIGLGAMGSAAAYHLSKRGHRILGLDRFTPPHTLGSSHGQTRVIREAYFEDPRYVPIVQRAYQLWTDLEHESAQKLFHQTGALMIGKPDSIVVSGALQSAKTHNLAHELLTAQEAKKRFPAFNIPQEMQAVFEPRAGALFVEPCIAAHLELAKKHGAQLRLAEPVASWKTNGNTATVTTEQGTYTAAKILFTAGAWTTQLLRDLSLPLTVERQIMFWFEPKKRDQFLPQNFPVFLIEHEPKRHFYGLPDFGWGMKSARHHEGELTTPDQVRRTVSPEEIQSFRVLLQRFFPEADGRLAMSAVCLYTNAPDGHFVIDRHLQHQNIIIASPCSGHGFKFASAMGEILADMTTDQPPRFDLSLFGLQRFH